jgi:hypothetical protein
MQKLTGLDYIRRPLLELLSHPDFDQDIFNKLELIGKMTTEELKRLEFLRGVMNG